MRDAGVMVSVIVLTYNHKKYIRQALDSILEQKTAFSYEILVGDDCSSDGTSEIISRYAAQHPGKLSVFIRPENVGATKNLYDLFQRAGGKYIASCEGDDYWCDSLKLQKQIDFLENHPKYSGCTHACLIVDENGKAAANQRLPWVCLKEHYTLRDFRGVYLPGQAATLVHRNFFLDTEHDYSIIHQASPMVADRTVVLILTMSGPIRRLPETMSCYRRCQHSGGQSATTVLFQKNQYVNQMQIEFTRRLERYVKEEFGVHIYFTRFKLEQFIKAKVKSVLRTVSNIWRGHR